MPAISPQPVTWLIVWSASLLALLHQSGYRVLGAAGLAIAPALWFAARQFLVILRRSRWLLLATVVAFGWMTPGMPMPGLPGASIEGFRLAIEQGSRLLISIAMTALLLSRFEFPRLLAGLRGVAQPLRMVGVNGDRGVIRLALVLDELSKADRRGSAAWALLDETRVAENDARVVTIPVGRIGQSDALLLAATLAVLLAATTW